MLTFDPPAVQPDREFCNGLQVTVSIADGDSPGLSSPSSPHRRLIVVSSSIFDRGTTISAFARCPSER